MANEHRTLLNDDEIIIGNKRAFSLSSRSYITLEKIKDALKKSKYDEKDIEQAILPLPGITPYLYSVAKKFCRHNEITLSVRPSTFDRAEKLIYLLKEAFNCKEIQSRLVVVENGIETTKIKLERR